MQKKSDEKSKKKNEKEKTKKREQKKSIAKILKTAKICHFFFSPLFYGVLLRESGV